MDTSVISQDIKTIDRMLVTCNEVRYTCDNILVADLVSTHYLLSGYAVETYEDNPTVIIRVR